MPQNKKNKSDPTPIADDCCRSATQKPVVGHYICLSHPPSDTSIECTSCHSNSCNENNCRSVKVLNDCVEPSKVIEVHISRINIEKCEKCGLEHENVNAGIQTARERGTSLEPCITCSHSTAFSSDRLKAPPETSSSQRSFRISPASVKPHSCIRRPSDAPSQSEHNLTEEPKELPKPETCQDKNCSKRQSQDGGHRSSTNMPNIPNIQNMPNMPSMQNIPTSQPPPSTPQPRCLMSGCPVTCIPEEQNASRLHLPAQEPSKIYSMPPHQSNLPKRQGSNIASNANRILSSSLLRKNSNQNHKIKKRSKDSKTSIKSNASKCKCPGKSKKEAGCACHYPPAFQHYFQCTGTITGVCCCSENK